MNMNIEDEYGMIRKTMKNFNSQLGERTHFTIYDFKNPIRKKKFRNTMYYYFSALIITKDSELIPAGKHTIQLPSKRVVYPLYEAIKEKEMLDFKEITVTILKKGGNIFEITVHK